MKYQFDCSKLFCCFLETELEVLRTDLRTITSTSIVFTFLFQITRASQLRKAVVRLLRDQETFHGQEVWSKFQILRWCRHHLYTPLDEGKFLSQLLFLLVVDDCNR